VQRIVITSSCAAILSLPLSKPTVFSEEDWNSGSIKDVQEMGNKTPPSTVYRASKTLAEKGGFLNILSFGLLLFKCFLRSAAWDFYEQHKSQIKWDVAVINPPFVSCCFFTLPKKKDNIANCYTWSNNRYLG
jgi:hypothetical protein